MQTTPIRLSRAQRTLRGSALALVAGLVAAVSHTAGGGAFPHPLLVATAAALTALVGTLLGARATLPRLIATVGVAQGLFHVVYAVGDARVQVVDPDAGGTPHAHHTDALVTSTVHTHASPAMWVAHLVAAVVTVALVHHAERLLVAVVAAVRAVAGRLVLPRAVAPSPRPSTPRVAPPRTRRFRSQHVAALPARGPPLSLAS